MLCPLCAAVLPAGAVICPGCGADLADYINTKYQPDLLFNEALTLLRRESYSDACALLCRAHAYRPKDVGILDLWMRAEYDYGNKKRALELMTDLMELDDSPWREEQFKMLAEEYDREQAEAGILVKSELQSQNDRLGALLDRLESSLDIIGELNDVKHMSTSSPAGFTAEAPMSSEAGTETAKPADSAEVPSGETKKPSESGFGDGFYQGGFPDFSRFSDMFPNTDD